MDEMLPSKLSESLATEHETKIYTPLISLTMLTDNSCRLAHYCQNIINMLTHIKRHHPLIHADPISVIFLLMAKHC